MPPNLPCNDLLEWCHAQRQSEIELFSESSTELWLSGLAERIAALDHDTIDTPDADGITALGRLASYRPPEELKSVIAQGVEQLLAAGANPLSATSPAILRGQVFSEDLVVNTMLAALVNAQRAAAPYRLDGSAGNLLHAMVNGNVGTFAHLAQDNFAVMAGCREVVAAWRDEVDAHGKTPVDLAWERYPGSRHFIAEDAAALWLLLLPGKGGVWQPPRMDMQCADGSRLYQRVLMKVDQGMAVPRRAEGLLEQLRALALGADMHQDTPGVSDVLPVSPRPPRL